MYIIICTNCTYSQNLIINSDAEISPFTNNGWVQVSGDWQQRVLNPLPQNGDHYFFAGANPFAELYQEVDVSDDQVEIDNENLQFTFSCYLHSWPQVPTDEANATVEYLDSSDNVLDTYNTDFQTTTSKWVFFSDTRVAPIETRTIKITLISIRNNGVNNDGYFDNLQLTKEQVLSTEQFLDFSKQLILYPNPANNFIQISGLEKSENYVISNILGVKIKNGNISNQEKINIKNLTNGLYFLKFKNGNTIKFIRE